MAQVTIAASGGAGTDVVLAADTLFFLREGPVEFSTDGGTTYIPFKESDKVVFSSGLTVKSRTPADRMEPSIFLHMPM